MLDPAELSSRIDATEKAKQTYQDNFGSLNMTDPKVYQNLLEVFWYSQLPCFDLKTLTSEERDQTGLLKRCYWKGQLMSCQAIFTTRPTDRGMCCTFNMRAADKIFKESRYAHALERLQMQDKNLSFPPTQNEHTELEDIKPQAGLTKGLTVVVDAHGDLVATGSVSDNFKGFTATITAPGDFPITKRKTRMIKPGQLNMVEISATNVEADETIRDVQPKARHCYFANEYNLKLHKSYSQRNCYLECSLEYASKTMKKRGMEECIPWFYPIEDNTTVKMCDPWEQKTFQSIIETVSSNVCEECLPDCTGNIYDTKVDRADFKKCDHTNLGASMFCNLETGDLNPSIWSQDARSEFETNVGNVPKYLLKSVENKTQFSNKRSYATDPEALKNMPLGQRLAQNPTYDAFENDIAMAYFYFENEDILQIKRNKKMTTSEYVSAVGGNLGLGIGFSLISMAEIIYWLTIRFWRNIIAGGNTRQKN